VGEWYCRSSDEIAQRKSLNNAHTAWIDVCWRLHNTHVADL